MHTFWGTWPGIVGEKTEQLLDKAELDNFSIEGVEGQNWVPQRRGTVQSLNMRHLQFQVVLHRWLGALEARESVVVLQNVVGNTGGDTATGEIRLPRSAL